MVFNMAEKSSSKFDILGLLSFGFFLVLLGAIFALTPGLPNKIIDFVRDFHRTEVYSGVIFFAPSSKHPVIYNAAFQFCLVFAIFQVVVLVARFAIRDSIGRKAETLSGIVFWFGAAAALNSLIFASLDWFVFLGWLIVLIGLAIVIRSAVAFAFWGKG